VRGFRIYFDGPNRPNTIPYPLFLDVPSARTWTATSLAFGTTYTARIATVDVLGQESPGVTVVATTLTVPPGDVELPWNPGADGVVYSTVMQNANSFLALGGFSSIGGVSKSRIARLNLDGVVDPSFQTTADDGTVLSAYIQPDGKIIVTGTFTFISGAPRNRIVRLNPNGTTDLTFNASADNTVRGAALQSDGKIVIAGFFTSINGVARNRIARLNHDGSLDLSFNPNADASVRTIILQADGKLLVGGHFSTIAGAARQRLARLNADGTIDSSFVADIGDSTGSVQTILPLIDEKIMIGGAFATVNSSARANLARVLPSGAVDPSFSTDANSTVWTSTLQTDGRILLGGSFTSVGSVTRNRAARLLADGTLDSTFNPSIGSATSDAVESMMLQPDGKIVVGGFFTTVGGQPRNRIARLYNNPAPSTLGISNISQLTWQRGGASGEATQTLFDVTTNNGLTWLPLGNGSRVTGGWERTGGFELPPTGLIRGRARTASGIYGTSSGFIETLLPYNAFSSAEAWRQFYFNTTANNGNAADSSDPDSDGLSNLVERAFGGNPIRAATGTLPPWQWTQAYGTSTFEAPAGITGITYGAEWSTSMAAGDWHAIPDSGTGGRHTFTFALNDAPRVFVRWRITQL
jgi:uncharacterized delta-60 repeat protein